LTDVTVKIDIILPNADNGFQAISFETTLDELLVRNIVKVLEAARKLNEAIAACKGEA
jgi:hypothetical protein